MKYVDDGKIDLTINIPITKLMEQQAYWSFSCGVHQVLLMYANAQRENRLIDESELSAKFAEWGLADVWEKVKQRFAEAPK